VDDHQSTYLTKLGKKNPDQEERIDKTERPMVLLLAALCLPIYANCEQKF
jgi:hypothetical protein